MAEDISVSKDGVITVVTREPGEMDVPAAIYTPDHGRTGILVWEGRPLVALGFFDEGAPVYVFGPGMARSLGAQLLEYADEVEQMAGPEAGT